jgi:tRNA-binding EMAP/Myf-like protein
MVGKIVIYLANLAPRKIRGVLSQGMILAAVMPRCWRFPGWTATRLPGHSSITISCVFRLR